MHILYTDVHNSWDVYLFAHATPGAKPGADSLRAFELSRWTTLKTYSGGVLFRMRSTIDRESKSFGRVPFDVRCNKSLKDDITYACSRNLLERRKHRDDVAWFCAIVQHCTSIVLECDVSRLHFVVSWLQVVRGIRRHPIVVNHNIYRSTVGRALTQCNQDDGR